jgi:hypothetical protein
MFDPLRAPRSDCLLYSCQSRGNGEAGDWKANGTGEIAAEKAKVLVRVETARNLPPRTTDCVPGNEQCVCHRGSKDGRSARRARCLLRCCHAAVQHDDIMGRLTLNVLLSFAQFEREVTGERIRDKIAASKQKGMWMGGLVPLGYEVIAA